MFKQTCGKPKIIFQAIPSINPMNVGKIGGYVTQCASCAEWIIVRQKVPSRCVYCWAIEIRMASKDMRRLYRCSQWRKLRIAVFELKGRKCVYCGNKATHIDHQIPVVRGGTNQLQNLEPVCGPCNTKKHRLTHQEYLLKIKMKSCGNHV